jgi:hypothetical protein
MDSIRRINVDEIAKGESDKPRSFVKERKDNEISSSRVRFTY